MICGKAESSKAISSAADSIFDPGEARTDDSKCRTLEVLKQAHSPQEDRQKGRILRFTHLAYKFKSTDSKECRQDTQRVQVLRRLGDGRWGEVYEAEVSGVGRAAVKLLADSMIEMEGDIEYSYYDFRREVSIG